jgi:uncharacterized protein (DUF2267 family)
MWTIVTDRISPAPIPRPIMTYDAFLDTVQERLDLADRDDASALTRIVLETFSEILYRTERDTVSAPLPKELAHSLHAAKTEQTREKVERLNAATFLDRVQARADLNRGDAETATATVLSVLQEAAGDAVLSDLSNSLPPSYAEIFPFMPHSDADTTA